MIHCQSEDENRPDDCYVINRHPQKYQNWKLEEQNDSGNVDTDYCFSGIVQNIDFNLSDQQGQNQSDGMKKHFVCEGENIKNKIVNGVPTGIVQMDYCNTLILKKAGNYNQYFLLCICRSHINGWWCIIADIKSNVVIEQG